MILALLCLAFLLLVCLAWGFLRSYRLAAEAELAFEHVRRQLHLALVERDEALAEAERLCGLLAERRAKP